MKATLIDMEKEQEAQKEAEEAAKNAAELRRASGEDEDVLVLATGHTLGGAEDDDKPPGFAEMLNHCRNSLRVSRDWIGEDELRDADASKLGRRHGHPMEFVPLENFHDAVEFSVKRVVNDEAAVMAACHTAGIGAENDHMRIRALGKVVRIMQNDPVDKTVKCRVPGVGDTWFGLGALSQLRPCVIEEDTKKGSSEAGISASSEEVAGQQAHEEVMRRIGDLETEKRIGQQTVTEAINAVSELKWQQVKEKTDRAKLQQKILGLKKKMVSRAKEHRLLAQEAVRQEERLAILSQSKDEYKELVINLREEHKKLQEKLGTSQPLALEDRPSGAFESREQREMARARERGLALEALEDRRISYKALEDRPSGPADVARDRDPI